MMAVSDDEVIAARYAYRAWLRAVELPTALLKDER